MPSPGYFYTHPILGHLVYVGPQMTTDNTCDPAQSLFIDGHFTERILTGDRLDPRTGKIIKKTKTE